jgi:hypothetical protein
MTIGLGRRFAACVGLDLTNFPHQQGNLKFEIEF